MSVPPRTEDKIKLDYISKERIILSSDKKHIACYHLFKVTPETSNHANPSIF